MIDLPPPNSPIKHLEIIWLKTSCAYACFDETIMADTDWDYMAKNLVARASEWSPYFRNAIKPMLDSDVGATSSGINWEKGLPLVFYMAMVKEYGRDPLGLGLRDGSPRMSNRSGAPRKGSQ